MIDFEKFKTLDFKKSVIEDICIWCSEDLSYNSFTIDGKFFGDTECPYFDLGFDLFPEKFDSPEGMVGAEIVSLDISQEENYSVKLVYSADGERRELNFLCKKFSVTRLKYRGMSYRNLYSEWVKDFCRVAYVESDEYFEEEEFHELEDGFTLSIKNYSHREGNRELAVLAVCELRDERLRYQYRSTSYSNPHTFFKFVRHSNGHRYFPFHIDLYGMSFFDLDNDSENESVYHYIPEGYEHNTEWTFGESFIVTDVNYDSKTDLIVYNGCYWAGPSDVMVGDFSNPMSFDPHLVSINSIIDPEGDECYDTDFVRFEEGMLVVFNEGGEHKIPLDLISKKIKEIV